MKKIKFKTAVYTEYPNGFAPVDTEGFVFEIPGFDGFKFVANKELEFLQGELQPTRHWIVSEFSTGMKVSGARDARNKKEAIQFATENMNYHRELFFETMRLNRFKTINT